MAESHAGTAAPAAVLMLKPDSWAALYHLTVMDPDGWRTPGAPSWDEPITEADFRQRVAVSTIRAYGYPATDLLRRPL